MSLASKPQDKPKGKGTPIYKILQYCIEDRARVGKEKYGEVLKAHNGRDPLIDLLQELIDGTKYCLQELVERYGEEAFTVLDLEDYIKKEIKISE